MAQLAFAKSFWESYDILEKRVKAGVRKAMEKFHELPIAELYADKGLHLESVEKARDPRMRTIRVTDNWRGVVLAPADGSDTFLLLNVVPHDQAYSWAAKRLSPSTSRPTNSPHAPCVPGSAKDSSGSTRTYRPETLASLR
ncbi:MAG TPA: hypothetical protein VM347_14300 [Nonomuraea sp.]|nr:hypothetical protein [Nonomuraea sp.]